MTKDELIQQLQEDLRREYAHWHFYMASAIEVIGLDREEYREFFLKEAAGEMKHIQEWGDLILGLGGTIIHTPEDWVYKLHNKDVRSLLLEALAMETQVVQNFVYRMQQAQEISDVVDGRYIEIFLEDQLMDSRGTVDHLKRILATE